MEKEAGKYSPDLIIWSYVLNDPAHPVYQDANGELGRYFYSPRIHLVDFIQKKLLIYRKKVWLKIVEVNTICCCIALTGRISNQA